MGTEGCCKQHSDSVATSSRPVKGIGSDSSNKCCNVNGSHHQTSDTEVPHIPVTVDENDVISGAKEILRAIRPHWDLAAVEFKKFTDGITNKLVGCFHKLSPISKSTTNQNGSTDHTNNVVLVRVYGNKTDLLIDRKAETRNIKLLHTHGFAPSLFATFKNGLAYEYVPGVTLNSESVLRPEVWRLVANRMASMHKVSKDNGLKTPTARESMLWMKMQRFFDLVPERFSDPDKQSRLEKTFLPIAKIRSEFESLYKRLKSLGSPLVFAHNDLLLGNVIYTESLQKITFIDYEYADYNFQAFDIGNHFAEFAGVDEVDYSRYPSKEFQLEWLRVYLETFLGTSDVKDEQIEQLYVQVNQFALAAHFFWTIWALIQAEFSNIDFDFVDYAFIRYNEYLAKKEHFLSLKSNTQKSS